MLEEKVEQLIAKRKLLNNSNSFKDISRVWDEIKQGYSECKKEVKEIFQELDSLNSETSLDVDLEENFDFDKSFEAIKEISEMIKTCSVSKFVELIKNMAFLKKKCLKYLSAEKAKIEEIL